MPQAGCLVNSRSWVLSELGAGKSEVEAPAQVASGEGLLAGCRGPPSVCPHSGGGSPGSASEGH